MGKRDNRVVSTRWGKPRDAAGPKRAEAVAQRGRAGGRGAPADTEPPRLTVRVRRARFGTSVGGLCEPRGLSPHCGEGRRCGEAEAQAPRSPGAVAGMRASGCSRLLCPRKFVTSLKSLLDHKGAWVPELPVI